MCRPGRAEKSSVLLIRSVAYRFGAGSLSPGALKASRRVVSLVWLLRLLVGTR
jgi:hypothetical protein